MASRRRRLGAHAARHRPGAPRHRRSRPAAAAGGHARRASATISASRRRRRSSTAASGRSTTSRRASRRPSALLDRLNVQTIGGYDVAAAGHRHRRAPPEAARVLQIADAGRRRRVPPAGGKSRPRAAGAGRDVGLPRAARATFDCSAIDRFLERARALGVEHRPPEPIVKGRHLLELGVEPGPRMGEILRAALRAAAGRSACTTLDDGLAASPGTIVAGSRLSIDGKVRLEMNRAAFCMCARPSLLAAISARSRARRAGAGKRADRPVCRRRPRRAAALSRRCGDRQPRSA